jgi:aryl-alcohol dehydrogenase-like predicted oxidoreductase
MMEYTDLAPGHRISRVIKGGWQLAGGHGAIDRATSIEDMIAFADAGITTFDCADIYTGVEEMIGAFRTEYLNRAAPRRWPRSGSTPSTCPTSAPCRC